MTFKTRRTTLLSLRIVEETEFSDDEPPTLSGIRVVSTTGECVEETTRPLRKCAAVPKLKLVAGGG